MTSWLDAPIFFGGHRKSGTTLLLNLFDQHPQLCVFPPDSGFFYAWYPRWDSDANTDEEKIQRVADVMFGNFVRDLEKLPSFTGTFDRAPLDALLRERLQGAPLTPANVLRSTISAFHEATAVSGSSADAPAPRGWIEKTTSTEIYAAEIFTWFPNARFVHLVRDPRDNYGSLKSGWNARYHEHNDEEARLLQSMLDRGVLGLRMARANAERFGADRYRVVRYEDLVTAPEATLRELCAFMRVDFVPSLLEPTYHGLPWPGNNFEGRTFTAPSSVNVDRWRERITPHDAAVIEFHAGDLMRSFGYETAYSLEDQADAAREHYKWHNFAQQFSVVSGATTYAT